MRYAQIQYKLMAEWRQRQILDIGVFVQSGAMLTWNGDLLGWSCVGCGPETTGVQKQELE